MNVTLLLYIVHADTTDGTSTARIIVPVVVGVLLIILLVLVAVIILGVIMHLRRSSRKYIPCIYN